MDTPNIHREPSAAEVALEHLALDEADLRARVADLETDAVTLRLVLLKTLHALADVTHERDSFKTKYHGLLDERRTERSRAA